MYLYLYMYMYMYVYLCVHSYVHTYVPRTQIFMNIHIMCVNIYMYI